MSKWPEEVVEAFAAAWASIDGKLDLFEAEKKSPTNMPQHMRDGYYEGYMYEASELLDRADKRIVSFDLQTRMDVSK